MPNEVGGTDTTSPKDVHAELAALLSDYNALSPATFIDIFHFHVSFERIHPFQDGNGRVGRLLMFWQCLKNDLSPLIITEDLHFFYYRGLQQWGHTNGFLTDTCLIAQDRYKAHLDYFQIPY